MSMDYYVYLKRLDNFSIEECKKSFLNYDMKVDIHPDFNIKTQSGFLPFKLELLSPNTSLKGKKLLTGFEFYMDDYNYNLSLKELQPKGLKRFFKKEKYIHNQKIDSLLMDQKYLLYMNCHSGAFEVSVTFGVVAYLVKNCDGIFYDPQGDEFICDFDKEYFKGNINDLNEFYEKESRQIELFEEWR